MSLNERRSATALTVKSELRDDSCEDDLRKWVVAIALGKIVHVDRGIGLVECFRLTAARGRPLVDVRFTQKFAGRHSEFVKIAPAIAKGDGSKWRVTEGKSPRRSRRAMDRNGA